MVFGLMSPSKRLSFGGGDGTSLDLFVEILFEGGLGLGAEGVALLLLAMAQP